MKILKPKAAASAVACWRLDFPTFWGLERVVSTRLYPFRADSSQTLMTVRGGQNLNLCLASSKLLDASKTIKLHQRMDASKYTQINMRKIVRETLWISPSAKGWIQYKTHKSYYPMILQTLYCDSSTTKSLKIFHRSFSLFTEFDPKMQEMSHNLKESLQRTKFGPPPKWNLPRPHKNL